jgi:hypothetical protein
MRERQPNQEQYEYECKGAAKFPWMKGNNRAPQHRAANRHPESAIKEDIDVPVTREEEVGAAGSAHQHPTNTQYYYQYKCG